MQNLNLWRKAEPVGNQTEKAIKFKSVKRDTVAIKPRQPKQALASKNGVSVKNRKPKKMIDPQNVETRLREDNKLHIVGLTECDKENQNTANIRKSGSETQFHELGGPKLSIQRNYLEKIERDIGIRKWSRAE